MVPLDTLVTARPTSGPEFTNRFNLYRSAELTGVPAEGYSSAQALTALEEVAKETLPPEMGYDWADMSYQEKRAPNPLVVFALAIFLVFLVLAAQYQSWGLPFSVLLGTPFAAFGAYFGLWVARQYSTSYVNNVFAQIGLIMLIGLAAKNAILIVEFAKMLREQGKDPVTAALEGARLRFRPILMTAFAFILGVVPLLRASGAGAEGRKVMGMAVFSGMLIATFLARVPHPGALRGRREDHRRQAPQGARRRAAIGPRRLARSRSMSRSSLLRLRHVGVAGLLVWSSACAPVGPDYKRPDLLPPRPASVGRGHAAAATLADTPWWQVFDDEALQALIRDAVAHNLDLRVASGARPGVPRAGRRRQVVPVSGNQPDRRVHRQPGVEELRSRRGAQPDADRTFNNSPRTGRQSSGRPISSAVCVATTKPPSTGTSRPKRAAGRCS